MLCRTEHPRFLIHFLFLYHSRSAFSSLLVCFCRQNPFCCPACLHIISFHRRLQDIRPLSCEQIREYEQIAEKQGAPAEAAWSVKVAACQPTSVLGGETPREVVVTLTADTPEEALAAWLGAVPRDRLRLALPVAVRDADLGPLAARVGALADRGFRRFECADLATWRLLRDLQPACDAFDLSADWTWYAANAEAVRLQRACGIAFGVTGPEANLPNLLSLPEDPPREVLVAGYAPLFIAETPPLLPHPDGARLDDRAGEALRVTRLGRHWVTFAERPWSAAAHLPELLRNGFGRLRVDLSWAGAALPCRTWRDPLAASAPLAAHFAEPRL